MNHTETKVESTGDNNQTQIVYEHEAWNTYMFRDKLISLGGKPHNINFKSSRDRGDKRGSWSYLAAAQREAGLHYLEERKALRTCVKRCGGDDVVANKSACGIVLPLDRYGKGNDADGRSHYCLDCERKRRKKSSSPSAKETLKENQEAIQHEREGKAVTISYLRLRIEKLETQLMESKRLLTTLEAEK